MSNAERIEKMKSLLDKALSPSALDIIDDSHHHVGHAGAKSGAGHFTVHITSEAFADKTIVQQHQMVYKVLNEMIGPDIHALSIHTKTS